MSVALAIFTDLLAVFVLAAYYFHRHQRRDLVLAYIALNSGVLAVTLVLASGSVSAGLGLGLFGILSIIRLRSDAITQEEIAYYFIFLATGLVAGLHPGGAWVAPTLITALTVVVLIVDHPRLLGRTVRHVVTIDAAYVDEDALRAHLEHLYGAVVKHLIVEEVDLVRDLTVVDVRLQVPARASDHRTPPLVQPPPTAFPADPVARVAHSEPIR